MRKSLLGSSLVLVLAILTAPPGLPQEPKDGPPPEPGTVLPPFVRSKLMLSAEQQKRLAALEMTMKDRLAKVLTNEQLANFDAALKQGPPKEGAERKGPPQGKAGGPPPLPSLLIPPHVAGKLQLTPAQQKQIADLDAAARQELGKILTAQQQRQFLEALRQGPGSKDAKPPR